MVFQTLSKARRQQLNAGRGRRLSPGWQPVHDRYLPATHMQSVAAR